MPPRTPITPRTRPGLPAPRRLRARRLACAAPAALAALLACGMLSACGSSSPGADAAASEQAQERSDEAKIAKFAKCLREHGIKAETAAGPNGGHGLKIEGAGPNAQAMESAQKACARYQPAAKRVNLSPQQKVELEERLQKFAKCMREHGIKVEVSTQGNGVQIGIHHHPGAGEPDPQSPGFQQAQSSCQKLLPLPPGAKGGPFQRSTGTAGGPKEGGSPKGGGAEFGIAGG